MVVWIAVIWITVIWIAVVWIAELRIVGPRCISLRESGCPLVHVEIRVQVVTPVHGRLRRFLEKCTPCSLEGGQE